MLETKIKYRIFNNENCLSLTLEILIGLGIYRSTYYRPLADKRSKMNMDVVP